MSVQERLEQNQRDIDALHKERNMLLEEERKSKIHQVKFGDMLIFLKSGPARLVIKDWQDSTRLIAVDSNGDWLWGREKTLQNHLNNGLARFSHNIYDK